MNCSAVHVRELAGWDFDGYEYRPETLAFTRFPHARELVAERTSFDQSNVLMTEQTEQLQQEFSAQSARPDLLAEMSGLAWTLGVVDLRPLLAFQRRLFLQPRRSQPAIPLARDWAALLALSFGPARAVDCEMSHDHSAQTLTVRSGNPNLHIRATGDAQSPISIHAGSPFFEVACLRGRWFLRDGYHRAYLLLRAQIYKVPAVIVQAATIEELGATKPWFFSEDVLFSSNPPRVLDFLDEELVLEYDRPPLIKTLRITMEESLTPAPRIGEQS